MTQTSAGTAENTGTGTGQTSQTATLIQNSQKHLHRLEQEANRLRAARATASFKVIDLRGKVGALESEIRDINARLAQILHEAAALQQRIHPQSRRAESGADLSGNASETDHG